MNTHSRVFSRFLTFLAMSILCIVPAAAESAHEFVGVKKCSMCHKSEKQGEQFRIWTESAHAKAFETLGTDQAKAIAKTWGVEDPQTSGRCLKCHSTAYAFTEERVSQALEPQEGVSCESCHGAGKDYMSKTTMKDHAKAVEQGMSAAPKDACKKCHGAGGPVPENFDFESYWSKIKHPVKERS